MEKINFVNNSQPYINADNLNGMQDNVENAIADAVEDVNENIDTAKQEVLDLFNFSTTEKEVGKWIDNKPIYRKVIVSNTSLSSGANNINHGISNFKNIVRAYGFVNATSSVPNYYFGAYESANNFINLKYIDLTKACVQVGTGWGSSFTNGCTIVLEYTKTTD